MLQPRRVQYTQGWVVNRAGVVSSRIPMPFVTRLSTVRIRRVGCVGVGSVLTGSLVSGGGPGFAAIEIVDGRRAAASLALSLTKSPSCTRPQSAEIAGLVF